MSNEERDYWIAAINKKLASVQAKSAVRPPAPPPPDEHEADAVIAEVIEIEDIIRRSRLEAKL